MNLTKTLILLLTVLSLSTIAQPRVSFTFDDGSTQDKANYKLLEWNQMILDKLEAANVRATFFTNGNNLKGKKGAYVMESWDNANHQIANHTYSHPNYNTDEVTFSQFKAEIIKQDSVIAPYNNYTKLFRFPYLREGNTPDKVDSVRVLLKEMGYRNGYVTIDDSDWYINSKLIDAMRANDEDIDLTPYRDFYVNHIFEVAIRSEALGYKLTGRNINHTLLLHHNLVNALFLDALIEKFQQEGWTLISSKEAFDDPIYHDTPNFSGNGLLDAIANDRQIEGYVETLDEKFNTYDVKLMDNQGL